MRLIDLYKENKAFRVVDASSGETFDLENMLLSAPQLKEEERSLVFLYLDNDVESLQVLLTLLNSNHIGALFSHTVNERQRTALESIYKPAQVYDKQRKAIEGYEATGEPGMFFRKEPVSLEIAPEIKLMLSTSGSTGSPKLVKLSEENLISNARAIAGYLPINEHDVCPLNLPVTYSYGLSVLNSNAISGGTMVAGLADIMTPHFWKAFTKYGFTSLAGVPIVYEILKRFKFTKKEHPGLRYLSQAGGKLSDALIAEFHEYSQQYNIEFYVMYGQTEATARMSYLSPEYMPQKLGSIGKAIDRGGFHLDATTGELIYTGPNVFGGYAEQASDLSTYQLGQTLKTGDIARCDEEGFYYIIGRSKRFVKLDGSRFSLDELENYLSSVFQEGPFRCLNYNDDYVMVVATATHLEPKEVIGALSSEFKLRPARVRYQAVNEMPLLANGKIDEKALRSSIDTNNQP